MKCQQLQKVGDKTQGICDLKLPDCPHARSGTNSTGSPNVYVNGSPVHRKDDTGSKIAHMAELLPVLVVVVQYL